MTTSDPLISFVVPCYNYGRFLPDCLNSIFRQEGDYNFEIIAIDDCSTDNTLQILEAISDPRLKILRHPVNQGHGGTITDGLNAARGKFIARIDPDDRYRPCFLKETVPIFDRYPEVGLVHGDVEVIDGAGNPYNRELDTSHKGKAAASKGNVYVSLLARNSVASATVIARREMWHATLPLPSGLAFSDWYFNLMMARRCEFYFVPEVLADYRIHGANDHIRIMRNKTQETCILFILERLFAENELSPELEKAKQSAKAQIYATHFWEFANQYFGYGLYSDARRCYLETTRYQPAKALSPALWRRVFGTLIGKRLYNALKTMRAGTPGA